MIDFINNIVKFKLSGKSSREYEYHYDPEHKSRPRGSGWEKTEEGWSRMKDKNQTSVERQISKYEIPKGLRYKKFEEFETGKDKNYKYHVHFSKKVMRNIFDKGHFSIISAGPNTEEKKMLESGKMDYSFFAKRHEKLKQELEKNNIAFTECVGHYGAEESSILIPHDYYILESKDKNVMVHHKTGARKEYDKIDELGSKYKQDSVLHGEASSFKLKFTTGKNKGKECGGKGWKEVPMAKDFYTKVELSEDKISKVSMNIDGCFKEGLL